MKNTIIIRIIVAIGIIGYIQNAIKLTDCDFETPYKCEVIRLLGLIPVVGAVTGYMSVKDGKES